MQVPNISALGNWIHSWIQPSGAIHGFHNHSVWGSNPYRWGDFTAGHSTWSSPLMAGLSLALSQQMDAQGLALLQRLIRFQTSTWQDDGQYRHIGFQVGELLQHGLIHNAITNLSLGLTACYSRDYLPEAEREMIRSAVLGNMEACKMYVHGRAGEQSICNQEYARIWGKLLYQVAFDDKRWETEIRDDLDYLIQHFHVSGLPDADSEGAYHALRDQSAVEPAEYYGLMIGPLLLAYQTFGEERYLHHAGALCRHVARSAWIDERGQTRLHRLWYRHGEGWRKNNSPMQISGMGDSVLGIHQYAMLTGDRELGDFVERALRTYANYQNPRGFFAPATGWQSEIDVAPSTAWHTHDFHALLSICGTPTDFWTTYFAASAKTSVLLGDQCLWIERDPHWAIEDYFWQDVFKQFGRKDEVSFGRDMAWIGGERVLPSSYAMVNRPIFLKTDQGIYLKQGNEEELQITSIATLPYLGVLA